MFDKKLTMFLITIRYSMVALEQSHQETIREIYYDSPRRWKLGEGMLDGAFSKFRYYLVTILMCLKKEK